MTRFGVAGLIEVVAGVLIVLGLFTRPAAFIASGEMAVAYIWAHWAGQGDMWWWENGGELALVYCFVWLFLAMRGPGPFTRPHHRVRTAGDVLAAATAAAYYVRHR